MLRLIKLLGYILLLCLVSLLTYIFVPRPYQVHHHANMAAYIDGKKWDFSKDIYMEEVERCNVTIDVRPTDRIHLHENKGDIVHVHMAASTWGDLFSNLHWNFGSGYVVDDYDVMHLSGSGKNVYFFVNGKKVDNPHNRIVQSADRLLIWYGTGTSEEIEARANTLVDDSAIEYNKKADPASCSTNTYGMFSSIANPIHEWLEHHE